MNDGERVNVVKLSGVLGSIISHRDTKLPNSRWDRKVVFFSEMGRLFPVAKFDWTAKLR